MRFTCVEDFPDFSKVLPRIFPPLPRLLDEDLGTRLLGVPLKFFVLIFLVFGGPAYSSYSLLITASLS